MSEGVLEKPVRKIRRRAGLSPGDKKKSCGLELNVPDTRQERDTKYPLSAATGRAPQALFFSRFF
jgi:hypothetical protein